MYIKEKNPFRQWRNIERNYYKEMMFKCVTQHRLHDLNFYYTKYYIRYCYSAANYEEIMQNILDEITNEYGVSILYELKDYINNGYINDIMDKFCEYTSNLPSRKINEREIRKFIMEYKLSK